MAAFWKRQMAQREYVRGRHHFLKSGRELDDILRRKGRGRAADQARGRLTMVRADREGCGEMVRRNGKDDGVRRADERRKMMVVRKRALMVRKAAIRMMLGFRGSNAHRSVRSRMLKMQRRQQLEAEVPDKYEQEESGRPPPQKRQRLQTGARVCSHLKPHSLCVLLDYHSWMQAKEGSCLEGTEVGNRE